ncbi:MAG: 2TM domain-containing protein [Solirubrobacteraceae bacterium]
MSEPADTSPPALDVERMRAVAQVQRWHDFKAHLGAYLLINTTLVIAWAVTGGGPFWPGIPLAAWGLGLSSQHFLNSFSPITREQVQRELDRQRDK